MSVNSNNDYNLTIVRKHCKKETKDESGDHRLLLFSTKIHVSCRFCHFPQQSTKHNETSVEGLTTFGNEGCSGGSLQGSVCVISIVFRNGESSSAVACCYVLLFVYQQPTDQTCSDCCTQITITMLGVGAVVTK